MEGLETVGELDLVPLVAAQELDQPEAFRVRSLDGVEGDTTPGENRPMAGSNASRCTNIRAAEGEIKVERDGRPPTLSVRILGMSSPAIRVSAER